MRTAPLIALTLSLCACTAVDSAADGVMPPITPPATQATPAAPAAPEAPAPDEAFEQLVAEIPADDTPIEPEAPADELDANALLTAALPEPTEDEPVAAAPEPTPDPAVTPRWTPDTPMAGSWGVRLVSTLPDTQPPRAVLALGAGGEVVVEPGTMVPSAHLVVLAIGREAVQVARILPEGDHARVETAVLWPFYGVAPRGRAAE